MDRQVRTGLILLRVDASVNMIINLQDKKKTKEKGRKKETGNEKRKKLEVSQLAERVCSAELSNTILMLLVTAVDMSAFHFQEPNSYVYIKIYKL